MKKLQAVFFDLDGTLLDTATDLGSALNAVLINHNKPALKIETISKVVSNGAAALIELGFNKQPADETYEPLRQELLDNYLQNIAVHTRPYDGIMQCIAQLDKHDIQWGIVTNKPWAYTEPLMKYFQFASAPCAMVCPEHVEEKKPAPDGLLLACQQANCSPEASFYIGDHQRDITCGVEANSRTIAVNYGYIPEGENIQDWGANYAVNTATELWPILKKYI